MSGGVIDHQITVTQAEVHFAKSEYVQAKSLYLQTAETTSLDQDADAYTYSLLNLALIDIAVGGTVADVCQNLDKARESFSHLKIVYAITLCGMAYAAMELREQKFDLAKVKLQECLCLAWGSNPQVVSFCLDRLANTKAWQAVELQSSWAVVYLAFAQKYQEKLAQHKALLFLGDVFISNKDEDTAHSLYTVALDGFTYMDVHKSRAECMLRLGDLAHKKDEISEAIEWWKAARPLFEQSMQAKDITSIDTRLAAVENCYQAALDHLVTFHAPVQSLQELSSSNRVTSNIEDLEDSITENADDKALVI